MGIHGARKIFEKSALAGRRLTSATLRGSALS
jgi:hypothetical protein